MAAVAPGAGHNIIFCAQMDRSSWVHDPWCDSSISYLARNVAYATTSLKSQKADPWAFGGAA